MFLQLPFSFQNAFSYFRLLVGLRNDMTTNLIIELDKIVFDAENNMIKYAVGVIVVAIGCALVIAR